MKRNEVDSILSGLNKEQKVEFLKKLQSGNYNLRKDPFPTNNLNLYVTESGLYRDDVSGQEFTLEEVYAMFKDFYLKIELVDDLDKPPGGFMLSPYTKFEYLNGLLIEKYPKNKLTTNE